MKGASDIAWKVPPPAVHVGDTYTLDSGANLHMTKNFEHFSDYVSATSVETVSGIPGDILQIMGTGTVIFNGHNGQRISVSNVAYVPNTSRNLISIRMITRNTDARFSFDDRYCYMQDGTIIGEYFPVTLYQFIFSPIIPANYSLIANNLNMHSRLGHPSGRVMRKLGYSPSSEFKI